MLEEEIRTVCSCLFGNNDMMILNPKKRFKDQQKVKRKNKREKKKDGS